MALVKEVLAKEGRLEDIPVVNEFANIFPKELLGLPLEREIVFCIDLVDLVLGM